MLEYRTKRAGERYPVLVACPACGHDFGEARDGRTRSAHIASHDPADFGL